MKITETLLTQLTDTDTLLASVYLAVAAEDPNCAEEMNVYQDSIQALLQAVPEAESYLQAKRQKFASDIRFAIWQGFKWSLDCFQNPLNKLLPQLDFEEMCQESLMHTLLEARSAQTVTNAFVQSLPKDKDFLLDPIIDHFAYLETYGYKLAYDAGYTLGQRLLPLIIPGCA